MPGRGIRWIRSRCCPWLLGLVVVVVVAAIVVVVVVVVAAVVVVVVVVVGVRWCRWG